MEKILKHLRFVPKLNIMIETKINRLIYREKLRSGKKY